MVLERKTRGRQLHLVKRYKTNHLFCTLFATEEGPFGAETFCQVKLSTMCLTLKNQQIPIYRRGNESLLYYREYVQIFTDEDEDEDEKFYPSTVLLSMKGSITEVSSSNSSLDRYVESLNRDHNVFNLQV